MSENRVSLKFHRLSPWFPISMAIWRYTPFSDAHAHITTMNATIQAMAYPLDPNQGRQGTRFLTKERVVRDTSWTPKLMWPGYVSNCKIYRKPWFCTQLKAFQINLPLSQFWAHGFNAFVPHFPHENQQTYHKLGDKSIQIPHAFHRKPTWEADQIIVGVAALGCRGGEDLLGRKTILAEVSIHNSSCISCENH